MIPYDDLVAALSAWRARQGLPVNQIGSGGSGPTASPGSGPYASATPGSGPHATPGSGPNRAAPPMPPPSSSYPEMEAASAEPLEVGDEMLSEEAYDNEGNDFAMAFGAEVAGDGESTMIGEAPERPTEAELSNDPNREDW